MNPAQCQPPSDPELGRRSQVMLLGEFARARMHTYHWSGGISGDCIPQTAVIASLIYSNVYLEYKRYSWRLNW